MATTDKPLTPIEELTLAPAVDFIDPSNAGTDHSGPWTILQVMFGGDRVRLGAVGRVGEPEVIAPVTMLRTASRERFLRAVYGDKPICPRCSSPNPAKHPAMQIGGEVQLCRDPFHLSTELGRAMFKGAGGVVCTTCNDTHVMIAGDREAMCTRCPVPCQQCRHGGTGPFCEKTPCACACHVKIEGSPAGVRALVHSPVTTHEMAEHEKKAWSKAEQERVVAAEHDPLKCGFPDIDCEICQKKKNEEATIWRAEEEQRARRAQREWTSRMVGRARDLTAEMPGAPGSAAPGVDPTVLAATIIADAIERSTEALVRELDAIDKGIDATRDAIHDMSYDSDGRRRG